MSDTVPISLVVTDLDGTLWHGDDNVGPDVIAALSKVIEIVPLLVATGRRLTSTREPLARIGVAPPAIVLNGALGVDLATGERFHRAPYPTADAVAVLAAFRSVGLDPVIYVDDPQHEVVISAHPSTNPEHVRQLAASAAVGDLDRVVAEAVVLGFSMIGVPHGDGVAAMEAIGDLAEPHLDRSIEYPGLASFTAAPKNQSKWDGVLAFCASRGLDATHVLALGDGPNDVELLANAAVSLVPAVAHPAATALADHIIPSATDGGWVQVLDYLG